MKTWKDVLRAALGLLVKVFWLVVIWGGLAYLVMKGF